MALSFCDFYFNLVRSLYIKNTNYSIFLSHTSIFLHISDSFINFIVSFIRCCFLSFSTMFFSTLCFSLTANRIIFKFYQLFLDISSISHHSDFIMRHNDVRSDLRHFYHKMTGLMLLSNLY